MTYYPPSASPQPPPRRPRKTTWLWAALTFVALLLCSGLVLLALITGGQLPDFGNGPEWTPPAAAVDLALAATPGAPEQPSGETGPGGQPLPQTFQPGQQVRNASGGPVNLRQTPGFLDKPDTDIIAAIPAGSRGEILSGPVAADGLSWWQVRFPARGEGWMAERSSSGRVLLDSQAQ